MKEMTPRTKQIIGRLPDECSLSTLNSQMTDGSFSTCVLTGKSGSTFSDAPTQQDEGELVISKHTWEQRQKKMQVYKNRFDEKVKQAIRNDNQNNDQIDENDENEENGS